MEECVWLMLNFFWRYVLSIPDRMRFTVVPLKDAVFGFHANSLLPCCFIHFFVDVLPLLPTVDPIF